MRSIALLMAGLLLSAGSPPPAPLADFDGALAGSHFTQAGDIVTAVIAERTPADGKPRPDALLNAMFGRLLLAAHQNAAAGTYLTRTPIAELPPEMRAPTALALGRLLEMRGEMDGATAAYRAAAGYAASEQDRHAATLGIARQLLVSTSAAVPAQVGALASGAAAPDRWQARFLLALAASLQGDMPAAERFAGEAWADAALAPPEALAPLQVSVLRAGLASARHDVVTERAMLAASNGLSISPSSSISAQLPVCGDDGVAPSDFVTFGVVNGPYGTARLFPIAASRAAVVPVFYRRLAPYPVMKDVSGTVPKGIAFTVACRTVVSPDFAARPQFDDPLLAWLVENGIYQAIAISSSEAASVNAVSARIDALAARFGKDSPLLIAPKWQLLSLLGARMRGGDNVLPGQLIDLQTAIAEGLTRAGAPNWLSEPVTTWSTQQQLTPAATDPAEAVAAMQGLFRKLVLAAPFEIGRSIIQEGLSNLTGEIPPEAAQLIVDLDTKPHAGLSLRERQAWLMTVARAQRALGKTAESKGAIAAAGLPNDVCPAVDDGPDLLEHHFTYEDYPDELLAGQQEGFDLFEFAVTAAGTIAAPRLVISFPSELFDDISAKGVARLRYTAPKRAGKATTCRGVLQSVVWRLEDENDFEMPTLTPRAPEQTT